MAKHTMSDLYQMQSLPLSAKISMTARRINEWVNEFGEDGVYLSFSGGKDSTVLGHIIREVCGYKNIPFVFVDVPTQYPELKQFAQTFHKPVQMKSLVSKSQGYQMSVQTALTLDIASEHLRIQKGYFYIRKLL